MLRRSSALLASALIASASFARESLPSCFSLHKGESIEAAVQRGSPTAPELLARLAYAEGRSTGFAADPLVYEGIAWGVMNRVRLGEASPQMRRRYGDGVSDVIFRKGQFNPAVSPRSRYSGDFLCPRDSTTWGLAVAAATRAFQGRGDPFIQSDWERRRGLSLVVNFYYPASTQAKGPLAPWEGSASLQFIGPVPMDGAVLGPERIRFYRLTQPPSDLGPRSLGKAGSEDPGG